MGEDFQQWYEREYRRVLAGCTAMSGDYGLAREATDEAFTRALQAWNRVSVMSAPGGWTQTVALNLLKRARRRRRLERVFLSRCPVPAAHEVPLTNVDLWEAVRALPPRQRTAVVLRYLHDLPEGQVALAMGISRGAASAALSAARARLKEHLFVDEQEDVANE